MKRERLEDLGRIAEMIRRILREETDIFSFNPLVECDSKHTIDNFIKKYNNEDMLYELHNWVRHLKEKLEEIDTIAWGYDFEE